MRGANVGKTGVFVDHHETDQQWQEELLFIEQIVEHMADSAGVSHGYARPRKEYVAYIWHTHVVYNWEQCLAVLVKDPKACSGTKHAVIVCRCRQGVEMPIATRCVTRCRWRRTDAKALEVTAGTEKEMMFFDSETDLEALFKKLRWAVEQDVKEARELGQLHKHCTSSGHIHVPRVVPLDELELELEHMPRKW